MSAPVIALLTDFGTADHYVGTMKGVMLGICPAATLVDLTHEIAPQDILGGALELAAAFQYFPPGTTFLAVVDPGVGSARRAIAARAGRYVFVAPDNGLLAPVFVETPPQQVVEIQEARYARSPISRTFEGRDRFAPAAAWLASGLDIAALGPVVTEWTTLTVPQPVIDNGTVTGEVLRVDRFGNLISNIPRRLAESCPSGPRVQIDGRDIGAVTGMYAGAPPGAVLALFSSSGHLEIAVNGGHAATELGVGRGARVSMQCLPDAGL